jgi:CHAT domain-containing protein/tetratricopeptide (TPR) repeat protein
MPHLGGSFARPVFALRTEVALPQLKMSWSVIVPVLGLSLVLTGDSVLTRHNPRPDPPELGAARNLFNAGRYAEARVQFLELSRRFTTQKNPRRAAYALDFAAQCALVSHDFPTAMRELITVRQQCERDGDDTLLASALAAMASIHIQMGDLDAAHSEIEASLRLLPGTDDSRPAIPILTQAAVLAIWHGDIARARHLAMRSLTAASMLDDLSLEASSWYFWGEQLLGLGNLDAAEDALNRCFRIWRLAKHPMAPGVLFTLARLEHSRGNLDGALRLYDTALREGAKAGTPLVPYLGLYRRATVLRDLGRRDEALADLSRSFELARRWRMGVLPSDAARVGAQVRLDDVASALVTAAMEAYQTKKIPSFAQTALEVEEENRAFSLRLSDLDAHRMPADSLREYGATLAQLRAAEADLIRKRDSTSRSRVMGLNGQLDQFEIKQGLGLFSPRNLAENISERAALSSFQRALRPSEALLVFSRAGQEIYLWSATATSFSAGRLRTGASSVAVEARRFREALTSGSEEVVALGKVLYADLFGNVDPVARSKPDWLLVLDDALFEIPLAALVPSTAHGRPHYLVEDHTLQIVPGAWAVLPPQTPAERTDLWQGAYLGVGDPVYNRADPRFKPAPVRWFPWKSRPQESPMQLSRLPGSRSEVDACSRVWGTSSRVLTGPDATRDNLERELANGPAVVHFATHVVEGPDKKRGPYVALSLNSSGDPDFLGAREVATWRRKLSLVVLSGCGSGSGQAMPGAGLVGLTRSWMLAGAHLVAATYWATSEDDGSFFSLFFERLRLSAVSGPAAAAQALSETQRSMIHRSDWHSRPQYWGAYFLMGRR